MKYTCIPDSHFTSQYVPICIKLILRTYNTHSRNIIPVGETQALVCEKKKNKTTLFFKTHTRFWFFLVYIPMVPICLLEYAR